MNYNYLQWLLIILCFFSSKIIAQSCEEVYSYSVEDVCSGVAPTFTFDVGCTEGPNNNLDLDWYLYAPGGVPSMAPVGYDPLAGLGGVDNNFPIANADLVGGNNGLGGTWNGFICANLTVSGAMVVTNNGCSPIVVSYYAMPWDRALDTDGDGTFGEYNNISSAACDILRFDVTIYPASMSVVVTDDGSTCGTPAVELRAANGSVCETLTSTCTNDGDALNYDFSTTATGTALLSTPAGCALPAGSTGNIICQNCILPVELLSFTGKAVEKDNVLSWITETEINSDVFEVERSINGRDYISIGTVRAQGESLTTSKYSFIDIEPLDYAYYRLKMVDLDQSYEYSNTVLIERNRKNSFMISSIRPIPTSDRVTITFVSPEEGELDFSIFDVNGELLDKIRINITKGINEYTYDLSNYPPAIYVMMMNDMTSQEVRRIIKD